MKQDRPTLIPMYGLGDSLMCGLQGYDVRPEKSFFSLLSSAAGQRFEVPRVRWNMIDFVDACSFEIGSCDVVQLIRTLTNRDAQLLVEKAVPPTYMFATPGFTIRAFVKQHEESPGIPAHLRSLARTFINPNRKEPISLIEKVTAAGPAKTYVICLGGVEWISCALSRRKACAGLQRRVLRYFDIIIHRLLSTCVNGTSFPLIIVGSVINPTRLPLFREAANGALMIAFGSKGEMATSPGFITRAQHQAINDGVVQVNDELQRITESAAGLFVNLDTRFAELVAKGYAEVKDTRIPIQDVICPDLVHPTATGHSLIAMWFAEALRERGVALADRLNIVDIWNQQRSLAKPVNEDTWKRVTKILYESYLYHG